MSLAPSFCLSLSRMQNEDRFAGKLKLIKFRFLLGRPQPSPLTLISVPVQRHKMNWSRCSAAAAVDRPTRRLTGTNAISAEEGVLFLDDNPRCSSSPSYHRQPVCHTCVLVHYYYIAASNKRWATRRCSMGRRAISGAATSRTSASSPTGRPTGRRQPTEIVLRRYRYAILCY